MRKIACLLACTLVFALAAPGVAGALLSPEPAPEWEVDEWINGNPGRLRDQRGKVLVIEFFQVWCPTSNAFSLPLLRRWEEKYAARDDVRIVSIHSVFEGHDQQTPERLHQFVEDQGIGHSVGSDHHERLDDDAPVTMERFGAEGTPQIVIVDKDGQIRFSHFGPFDPATVEFFIDRLLVEGNPSGAFAPAATRSKPVSSRKTATPRSTRGKH